MHILHIDSSAEFESSHSRRASAMLVDALRASAPDATVTRRDVATAAPQHIASALRASWITPSDQRTAAQAAAIVDSEGLIGELRAADTLVIGAPMYNFSIPSTLKAWIDHVVIPGQTFRYEDGRPRGLLGGKRAFLVLSSGGIYSHGPASAMDFQEPYLRTVLGFIGITDVRSIRAEGVARDPAGSEAAVATAIRDAVASLDRPGEPDPSTPSSSNVQE